ncbi:hypothetical protein CkaCkLH20_07708 [Colletotrichum karsti]|uniref:NAD-dependent epimerase/dehydratase domain-containing protein n=1 Tax=Colletotrichum karsti TaxID=1095194 RepID=A0A9P6I2F8_9PEZI|nr:uncharacterized protein CkaCkLH20_07708 [Colletotrichum karsti]KAF9875014.1 hypothetical protein CkaCkLH20_07708 [Colletotrichum karsti]
MSQALKTTIPAGSWVLVTGATGFIASNVIRELLKRDYKVRGSVRDLNQASWLVERVFKTASDEGDFELVPVPDLTSKNAFDEAVKGVSAVMHVATITSLDPNPANVVPGTVDGALSVLKAAAKEPSVKEVVFTSSIMAAVTPLLGDSTHVVRDTWNEKAVKIAWAPPPYEESRAFMTYAASKVAAEKAVWDFVIKNQPHYTVNSINPSGVIGEPMHQKHSESPANWLRHLWNGTREALDAYPAAYFIDVKDVALLHVAAMLDPEVKNARLQAWGRNSNWNEFLGIFREIRPEHDFNEDYPEARHLDITTDQNESLFLLKKWGSQDGWRSLRDASVDGVCNTYFK